ncbi:MAG TPA: hypothetical protein VGR00_09790, partial [Thermoanaerobaculia bacterium]|nr:hypothetical protein [Thermoanaerobaculia bacterium]
MRGRFVATLALAVLPLAARRAPADGTPDPGFGMGGLVTTNVGSTSDTARAVVVQADGKIVVAGASTVNGLGGFALARYNADGTLDATFGTGGLVRTLYGCCASVNALAIQMDGKIVAAGQAFVSGSYDFAVARYETNGTLDTGFGTSGFATTNFGASSTDFGNAVAIQPLDGKIVVAGYAQGNFGVARYFTNGMPDVTFNSGGTPGMVKVSLGGGADTASAVALQSDGKIVVAGNSLNMSGIDQDFALLRLDAFGTPDPFFGSGGIVKTNFALGYPNDTAYAVAVQSDGKIVAAGQSNANTGSASIFDFALARYTTGGVLDGMFGTGGLVTTNFGASASDVARGIAIQPADGRIVVGGYSGVSGINDFAVARYATNGMLDGMFGSGGLTTTNFGGTRSDFAYASALQADGKVVLAGFANTIGEIEVARYTTGGVLDGTFGTGGLVTTSYGKLAVDHAHAVVVQSDGKVVVAGDTNSLGAVDFALARYSGNGTLDATFGSSGTMRTNFNLGSGADSANALALQSDGKIVAAGVSNVMGTNDFALARYATNGFLDSMFGSGGVVTTNFGASSVDVANAVAIQADGKIVVAGTSNLSGKNDFALVRYATNGTPDPMFGSGGLVTTSFGASISAVATAVAIQGDGKIVVAGYALVSGTYAMALARYDSGGTPDPMFGSGGTVTTSYGPTSDEKAFALALQGDGKIVAAGTTNMGGTDDFAVVRFGASGT